ncbi:fibronectin type III domain-containing protein [Actinopolymorpha alba]|uniref:fibronectin type III domain-containing protein n=1 Tax=Actinopolymorpha alba TaxID=533267 RepID=UPI000378AF82|nr:fibronectin type III domain-containing protein [Actinopolymorpha alba]
MTATKRTLARIGAAVSAVAAAVLASGLMLIAPAAAAAQQVAPPSNLRVTDVGPFTVDLAWGPATLDSTKSPRYFALDESGRIVDWFPTGATTSGTVTGLQPDTSYTLRVGAWNGTLAASPKSNPVTFTTEQTEPLPAPTNLRVVENQTGTDVKIDFELADDPRLDDFPKVTVNGRGHWNFGYDRANTSVTVHGLMPETNYTITISAVMDLGGGDEFVGGPGEVSVTTPRDGQPPDAPLGLGVRDRTGTSVTLTWGVDDPTFSPTDNVGVVDFLVSNGETTKVVPGDGSPFQHAVSTVFSGLEPETSYTFTVRARDAARNVSEPGRPATITTGVDPDTVPPTPVTNLRASPGGYNIVAWDASTDNVTLTGAIRYRVTTDGGTDHTRTGTSYYDIPSSGLPKLVGCQVTVVAIDGAGNTSEPRSTSLC